MPSGWPETLHPPLRRPSGGGAGALFAGFAAEPGDERLAMNVLINTPVVGALHRLHRDARDSDRDLMEEVAHAFATGASGQAIADLLAEERADYRGVCQGRSGNFLSVSPAYGRFLYMTARACRARRIVEFGSAMGISSIYLASALRDNGGGRLIGSEIETSKVVRAQFHLSAAELGDLVEIREGDALETLKDVGGPVDMLLLDGALSLYLPVLKLIEPHLAPGAPVLAENAFAEDYLDYVGDPGNGYLTLPLPIDRGRGNVYSVRVE